jgi:hypothetical protein
MVGLPQLTVFRVFVANILENITAVKKYLKCIVHTRVFVYVNEEYIKDGVVLYLKFCSPKIINQVMPLDDINALSLIFHPVFITAVSLVRST